MKPSILICVDWFAPGYKGGGPIRSCVNFAYAMRDSYTIYVLTSDRDWGNDAAYDGITTDTWMTFDEGIQVCYASPANLGYGVILEKIQAVSPDFIYLNSMYSVPFTIYPLWAYWRGKIPSKIILAVRGMLRSSALAQQFLKKKIYLFLFTLLGWHKKILFHATDAEEGNDITTIFGKDTRYIVAANLPAPLQTAQSAPQKTVGAVSLCYISRIHSIKNLLHLLFVLKNTSKNVLLDVFGPIEDIAYWQSCQQQIAEMPPNIQIRYCGELKNEQVNATLQAYHIFVLPTLGENFGHAIFEALQAGKPVLISDQTPWRNLESKQIGWDIALDAPEAWQDAIEKCADWDDETLQAWSKTAWEFAKNYREQNSAKEMYYHLFS